MSKHHIAVMLAGILVALVLSGSSGLAATLGPGTFLSPLAPEGARGKPQQELEPMAHMPLATWQYNPAVLMYGRKGVCGRDDSGLLDFDVYHRWWYEDPGGDQRKLARAINCPLVYDERWAEAAAEDAGQFAGRVWLVGNEVDSVWGEAECGVQLLDGLPVNQQPRAFAHKFLMVVDAVKAEDPTARTFCCGLVGPGEPYSVNWWNNFVDELLVVGRLDELDGVHVHGHPCCVRYCPDPKRQDWCWPIAEAGLESFISHVPYGLPVWITEVGCWNFCGEPGFDCIRDVMTPFVNWFEEQPYYETAMWYITYGDEVYGHPCTHLHDEYGELTPVGEEWSNW